MSKGEGGGRSAIFAIVDFQAEDVGAGVMAGDVEVELAFGDFAGIDVGGEDAFGFVGGAGEDFAEGGRR